MVAEQIEHEVLVDAPAEVVWEVLTESEHMGWFGGAKADVDLRPGGIIVFHWPDQGNFLALVTQVEHPRRLAYRWALVPDAAPAPGNATQVEVRLATQGAATLVTVVESGFTSLAGEDAEVAQTVAANSRAWTGGLSALAARAAKLAHQRR